MEKYEVKSGWAWRSRRSPKRSGTVMAMSKVAWEVVWRNGWELEVPVRRRRAMESLGPG